MNGRNMNGRMIHTMAAAAIIGAMALATTAQAAVTSYAYWRMGEEGGDSLGNLDSSGNGRTLSTNGALSEASDTPAPAKNGSTVYAKTPTSAGYYNTDTDPSMPLTNWSVEMWVRTNTNQSMDILAVNGSPAGGDLKITQGGTNWAPSYHNVAWIGGSSGAGQPVTFGQWTHLAVVDQGGVTRFYINGVVQTGATGTPAGVWGDSMHLSVNSGGGSGWDGDLDEVRVVTFGSGEFNLGVLNIVGPAFSNGSFESDVNGQTAPKAWQFTGNGQVNSTQTTSHGSVAFAFNGANATPNGVLSQTFATVAGQNYLLTFDFGKFATGGGTAQLDVDVFNTLVGPGVLLLDQTVADASGATSGVYSQFSFLFTATSSLTTLRFTDTSIGTVSFDTMLDNINVVAVPAPAALPAGLALIALAAMRRRVA